MTRSQLAKAIAYNVARAERLGAFGEESRLPRSVQAIYLRPLRRKAEHGLPVCDLQLRSYSVRNVEFFADFAIRAAYYLNLPVSGPVPLPRIVERWTVPRSNFVHKKSQENFERITLRRLIQIKDGNPQAVQAWLAFLRKHAFYGVGMKANVWETESLGMSLLLYFSSDRDTNHQFHIRCCQGYGYLSLRGRRVSSSSPRTIRSAEGQLGSGHNIRHPGQRAVRRAQERIDGRVIYSSIHIPVNI